MDDVNQSVTIEHHRSNNRRAKGQTSEGSAIFKAASATVAVPRVDSFVPNAVDSGSVPVRLRRIKVVTEAIVVDGRRVYN